MAEWKDVTSSFSEDARHYRNKYLEIDEVHNEDLEVSLFSSVDDKYEIYFSWDIFYGIVYADEEDAYELREQMKNELLSAYKAMNKPTDEFIDQFAKKYDVQMPSDIVFDEDAFMQAFMNLFDAWDGH